MPDALRSTGWKVDVALTVEVKVTESVEAAGVVVARRKSLQSLLARDAFCGLPATARAQLLLQSANAVPANEKNIAT